MSEHVDQPHVSTKITVKAFSIFITLLHKIKIRMRKIAASSIYQFLRSFLIAFLVAGVVTLGSKVAGTVYGTMNAMWEDYQIPYDIKWDYLTSFQLTRVRKAIENGKFGECPFIANKLRKWHKHVYKKILAKVPEGDGVRVVVWMEYQIIPTLHAMSAEQSLYHINLVLEALEQVTQMQSQSPYVQNIKKYELADLLLIWFICEKNTSFLMEVFSKWLPQTIHYSSILMQDQDSLQSSFRFSESRNTPFSFAVTSLLIQSKQVFVDYTFSRPEQFCKTPAIRRVKEYMDLAPELYEKYKKVNKDYRGNEQDVSNTVKALSIRYSTTRNFLAYYCNIHTKYDHFPITQAE